MTKISCKTLIKIIRLIERKTTNFFTFLYNQIDNWDIY